MEYAAGNYVEYEYDPLYRLKTETRKDNGGNQQAKYEFEYDLAGNRLSQSRYTSSATWENYHTYEYNNANQLTLERRYDYYGGTQDKEIQYVYNDLGDLTDKNIELSDFGSPDYNDEYWDYAYDAYSRLIDVDKDSNNIADYTFNMLGNRVKKYVYSSAETTKMLYDAYDCVADYDNSGTPALLRYYITPGLDENLLVYDEETTDEEYFYLHDGLGTVRQILDASQTMMNQYDYEGFGTSLSSTETIYNRFRYTGRAIDTETNSANSTALYYYRGGIYDSSTSMFFQSRNKDDEEATTYKHSIPSYSDPDKIWKETQQMLEHMYGADAPFYKKLKILYVHFFNLTPSNLMNPSPSSRMKGFVQDIILELDRVYCESQVFSRIILVYDPSMWGDDASRKLRKYVNEKVPGAARGSGSIDGANLPNPSPLGWNEKPPSEEELESNKFYQVTLLFDMLMPDDTDEVTHVAIVFVKDFRNAEKENGTRPGGMGQFGLRVAFVETKSMDKPSTSAHEIGHALGLHHPDDPTHADRNIDFLKLVEWYKTHKWLDDSPEEIKRLIEELYNDWVKGEVEGLTKHSGDHDDIMDGTGNQNEGAKLTDNDINRLRGRKPHTPHKDAKKGR